MAEAAARLVDAASIALTARLNFTIWMLVRVLVV